MAILHDPNDWHFPFEVWRRDCLYPMKEAPPPTVFGVGPNSRHVIERSLSPWIASAHCIISCLSDWASRVARYCRSRFSKRLPFLFSSSVPVHGDSTQHPDFLAPHIPDLVSSPSAPHMPLTDRIARHRALTTLTSKAML